jgi:TusA-related sulfurtransferase
MLDRAPALALGDLKPGDALMVLSTESATSSEVTAIIVLAGVEPILAAQPKGSEQMVLGHWNWGGGGEGGP